MEPGWVVLNSSSIRRVRFDASKGLLDVEFIDGKVFRYYEVSLLEVCSFLKTAAVEDLKIEAFKIAIAASKKKSQRLI
jgi:hypothetical protein